MIDLVKNFLETTYNDTSTFMLGNILRTLLYFCIYLNPITLLLNRVLLFKKTFPHALIVMCINIMVDNLNGWINALCNDCKLNVAYKSDQIKLYPLNRPSHVH